ncbi:MAG: hypothetical protein AAFZ18_26955 [Myxococcota bacterium]
MRGGGRPPRTPWVAALGLLLMGASECTKPRWVTELEGRADVAIPELEAALDALGSSFDDHVSELDRRSLLRLQDLDRALRDSVEGLSIVLERGRDRLDAALVARLGELTGAARRLTREVEQVAQGAQAQVSLTVDFLLATTDDTVKSLLEALDVGVRRVERAGDREVGRVFRLLDVAQVRIAALLVVVLLGVVGGLWFVWSSRQSSLRLRWLPPAAIGGVAVAALCFGLFPERFPGTGTDAVVIAHQGGCPEALALAATALATENSAAELSAAAGPLLVCQAFTKDADLLRRVRARLSLLRRRLGLDVVCSRNEDCEGGQRCVLETGRCSLFCKMDAHCPSGEVCHPAGVRCGPPCTMPRQCPRGECKEDGRCRRRRGIYFLKSEAHWRRLLAR